MTPPQHSITAPITFIHGRAFDWSNVKAERAAMPDGGDAHPLVEYFAGTTRYDIDAPCPVARITPSGVEMVRGCARDYLKQDHGCKEWRLRRLRAIEVGQCRDRGRYHDATGRAYFDGKVGQLAAFALAAGEGGPLTDAQVDAFVDTYGMDEICDVGEAALRASEAPKAAEKKL